MAERQATFDDLAAVQYVRSLNATQINIIRLLEQGQYQAHSPPAQKSRSYVCQVVRRLETYGLIVARRITFVHKGKTHTIATTSPGAQGSEICRGRYSEIACAGANMKEMRDDGDCSCQSPNRADKPRPEGPVVCKYCGREFKSIESLIPHLSGCPARRLRTEFEVGLYTVYVIWNPKRTVQGALVTMGKEYGKIGDMASYLAIIKFLKKIKYIEDYGIEKKEGGAAGGHEGEEGLPPPSNAPSVITNSVFWGREPISPSIG